jgi:hypothetical protein
VYYVSIGSSFKVQGSWSRVHGSGFMVQGSWFRVHGLRVHGSRVHGSGFKVQGSVPGFEMHRSKV